MDKFNVCDSMKSVNSVDVKHLPRSEIILDGLLYVSKYFSRILMTSFVLVDR